MRTFALLLACLACLACAQVTRYVSPSGVDDPDCGQTTDPGTACKSVRYAIVSTVPQPTDVVLLDGTFVMGNTTGDQIIVCDLGTCVGGGVLATLSAQNIGTSAIIDCNGELLPGITAQGNPNGNGVFIDFTGFVVQNCAPGFSFSNFGGTVSNVTVRNNQRFFSAQSNTATGAGAVLTSSSQFVPLATFSGCTFFNNTALGGNGGAISSRSALFSVYDSTFDSNSALNIIDGNGALLGGRGGAIYRTGTPVQNALAAVMEFHRCSFTNNFATVTAGALYLESTSNSDAVKISTDSLYIANNALAHDGNSGNVATQGSSSAVVFSNVLGTQTNSIVTDNVMTGEILALRGGAVTCYNSFQSVNSIVGWTITNNRNVVGPLVRGDRAGKGAGFCAIGTTAVIVDSTIADNDAGPGGFGAGVYLEPSTKSTTSVIAGTTVTGNRASLGAGIFMAGVAALSPVTLRLDNSLIANNVNATNGGGIYNRGLWLVLNSTNVTGNVASGNGGGVFTTKGSDTTAPGNGRTVLFNSVVSFNTAANGGGIYLDTNSNLTAVDSNIDWNNGTLTGAGVYAVGAQVSLLRGSVSHNFAFSTGGGLQQDGPGSLNIFNTSIQFNTAYVGNGGGIEVNGGVATIEYSYIVNNDAGRAGGGIDCNNAEINMFFTDVKIEENFCDPSGCCETGCYSCGTGCRLLPATFGDAQCAVANNKCTCVPGSTTTPPLGTNTAAGSLNFTCPEGTKLVNGDCKKKGGGGSSFPPGAIAAIVIIAVCCCCLCIVSVILCLIPVKKKRSKKAGGAAEPMDESLAFGSD